MSGQSSYNFNLAYGLAGTLCDLSPFVMDSRVNEESVSGKMQFGMGVVQGSKAGVEVKLPVSTSTLAVFEGIVMNQLTHQLDLEGNLTLNEKDTVGVLRQGRGFAKLKANISPSYGDSAYLITSGDNAGLFTLSSDTGETNKLLVNGRFIGSKGSTNVAPIELYGQIDLG